MKKKYGIVVICCLAVLISVSNVFGESKSRERALCIEEFGTKAGKPIDEGFVFFDGQYIDAPYIVSYKGLGIFINDVMIEAPIEWPIPDRTRPVQKVDPGLPEGMTEHDVLCDRILNHAWKKYDYLKLHYSQEEAIQKYVEYLRSFPFMEKVEYRNLDKTSILITDLTGRTLGVDFVGRPDTGLKFDKESVLKRLKRKKKYLERQLKNDTCYFLFSRGGDITSRANPFELLRMTQILRTSKSAEDKFKELHRAGWKGFIDPDDTTAKMVTNFSASPQLEKRLYKQIKSIKRETFGTKDLQKTEENDNE